MKRPKAPIARSPHSRRESFFLINHKTTNKKMTHVIFSLLERFPDSLDTLSEVCVVQSDGNVAPALTEKNDVNYF